MVSLGRQSLPVDWWNPRTSTLTCMRGRRCAGPASPPASAPAASRPDSGDDGVRAVARHAAIVGDALGDGGGLGLRRLVVVSFFVVSSDVFRVGLTAVGVRLVCRRRNRAVDLVQSLKRIDLHTHLGLDPVFAEALGGVEAAVGAEDVLALDEGVVGAIGAGGGEHQAAALVVGEQDRAQAGEALRNWKPVSWRSMVASGRGADVRLDHHVDAEGVAMARAMRSSVLAAGWPPGRSGVQSMTSSVLERPAMRTPWPRAS